MLLLILNKVKPINFHSYWERLDPVLFILKTQLTFTCLKSTIETLEKDVKCGQI